MIFNLDGIRKELDATEWEETEPGRWDRQIFVGTVFALLPSGKFYAPWACGNVTEEEAAEDSEWYEQAEEELSGAGLYLCSGEGDPCDLFVGEYTDDQEEACG